MNMEEKNRRYTRNKIVSAGPTVGLVFRDWLTGYFIFLSRGTFIRI